MSKLIFEHGETTPLCSFTAAVPRGAVYDPDQLEGLTRHAAELACRGAGDLDREKLDAAIDFLGGSIDVEVDRDWIALSATCLARNLDRTAELACSILADPRFEASEHEALIRESLSDLDDVRDDDSSLADRHFQRLVAPGHRYGRTTLGTDQSLERLPLERARTHHRLLWDGSQMIVGVAGAVSQSRADRLVDQLTSAASAKGEQPGEPLPITPTPAGRRIYLIDKPERSQCQLVLGHVAPRYGTPDYTALMPLETTFGGMFTSRLMQQVRVERGWSYGAGCRMMRARSPYWFRIVTAPTREVAVPALSLILDMYRDIASNGIAADELEFAVGHITGSLPFMRATARQRMRLALRHRLLDLPDDFPLGLGAELEALDTDTVTRAARQCLTPDDLCIVMVATADEVVPELERAGLAPTEIIPYDSY